ncbi:MAG TPA: NAD-dependent epimerase/dehydratase family protein [Caulobacteraceae bacterium]|jgi:nucleoside-diphosphate-sugar epimerase
MTDRTALIIGPNGSFGGHAMVALLRHGWTIRAMARDPESAAQRAGPNMPIDWVAGDAMNPADVLAAARGVQVIVHAANPPRYQRWRQLALPMLDATIAAAKAEGARIVLPGTVYNYAPDAGDMIAEDAPQAPVTRKGKVRVEMEQALQAASRDGVKTLVLRAGDFLGPAAPNSGLLWLTTRKGEKVTGVYETGPEGHDFAYLPDMAEALARLLDREADLADYDVFNFRGHWVENGRSLGETVRKVTGNPQIPIKAFPWWLIYVASPFVTMFRELGEMRYLWTRPIGLDDAKLRAFIDVPETPFDCVLRASLADLGVDVSATVKEPGRGSWTCEGARPYVAAHAGSHAV